MLEALIAISAFVTSVATAVMVWAVYVAPQKALETQWQLQLRDEERKRRLHIFRTLMATRAYALDYRHVEALNLIEIEFSSESADDVKVRGAWNRYLDHLIKAGKEAEEGKNSSEELKERENNRQDLLTELLQVMGRSLGYNFDFTHLKGRGYYPQGWAEKAADDMLVRKGIVNILSGNRSLPMEVTKFPTAPQQEDGVDRNK
jgi:hypothetical protein